MFPGTWTEEVSIQFQSFARLWSLPEIYRRVRPDLVQHFTVKPNLYGAVAATVAGVPLAVCGITGTGYAFAPAKPSRVLLRTILSAWYKFCSLLTDRLVFQTAEDVARVLGKGDLFTSKARVNPGGSGVDVRVFSPKAVPERERAALRTKLRIPEDSPVVTMASRLLWDKGVGEYVEAARTLRGAWPDVAFLLAGSPDPGNPDSVGDDDVAFWHQEGIVRPVGHIKDMPELLSISDVVALPTAYPEGSPPRAYRGCGNGEGQSWLQTFPGFERSLSTRETDFSCRSETRNRWRARSIAFLAAVT